MVDVLEQGTRLHAKFTDGYFYPAEVVIHSTAKKRQKAPVKVHFIGYEEESDMWLPPEDLKSKKLPKNAVAAKTKAKAKAKVKAKAKTKATAKAKRKRIAILGGALDPPTLNHLLGAAEVYHSGFADEVWLMPCGPRPDKPNLSKPLDRYIMTQLAVNSFFRPGFKVSVSDFEVMADEALATYDSLTGLSKKYPDTDFLFVIGTDWLQPGTDLRTWTSKDPETGSQIVTGDKLVEEFEFLVIQRPGYDVEDVKQFGPRMTRLTMPEGTHLMEGNLSSTEVRKRVDISMRAHDSLDLIEGLVAEPVLKYIGKRGLYHSHQKDKKHQLSIPPELPRRTLSDKGLSEVGKGKNIAVMGGAFDPPTNAHMLCLAEIIHSGVADAAVMVPCGPRPDKPNLRPPLIRYTMCELAVNSSFSHTFPVTVSPVEVFEKEALATYDALCALKKETPTDNFMFVIGSDWLQKGTDLREWTSKDPETGEQVVTGDKLVNEFDFVVVKRPGYEVEDLASFGPRMKWMTMRHDMKSLDSNVSSTEVRKRVDKMVSVDGLVPPGVLGYMTRQGLYGPSKPRRTKVS